MAVGDQANPVIFSYVATGKEGTFGTYASATTAIEALACSFQVDIKNQRIDALGFNRGYSQVVFLEKEIKGSLEQFMHPQESTLLIANALGGQISSTAQTNSTLHSISAGNFANSIASLSFNVRKGDSTRALTWRYLGGRCNVLKIVGDVGQPIKCSYDFLFADATQVADDISGILSLSSVLPFTFVGADYRYGASEGAVATESIQHFELTINNNLKYDKDVRQLGTNTATLIPATRREITLKTTQRFDTTTSWQRFLQHTQGAIELAFSGAAVVAATSASEYFFTMNIRLPNVQQLHGDAPLKSSKDLLMLETDWAVLLDNPSTSTGRDIGVTIRNSTASY